jgi:CDP-3, 6-dideoxy-D-glycero-L-glycero-4-hexulose-4-reductase
MKTILVTGASGVLAKAFISKYSHEYKIIEGVRKPSRPNQIQIDSWSKISIPFEIDAVVHFAGKYLVEESLVSIKTVSDAVVGTAASLGEFCKKNRTPLIALGSYFESAPLEFQPWSHYSVAKQSAAKILELASLSHDIPMRYFYAYDTYGNDLSRRKIIDVLLDPHTQSLELSPGEQKMNLTHEDDFVNAVKVGLDDLILNGGGFEKGQIRHTSDEFTLREIAEKINSIRTQKIDLNFGAKPYRKREVFDVWDCAPNLLGWTPNFDFQTFVSLKVRELSE